MAALAACLWILLAGSSLMLWARLRRLDREREALLPDLPGATSWRRTLARAIRHHLEETLLGAADYHGFASLPVPAREQHDAHRSAAQLLAALASAPPPADLAAAQELAKLLYQLQDALGLPPAAVEPSIAALFEPLRGTAFMDRSFAGFELVRTADLVDRRTMWPLTSGTRVRLPLGVVAHDAEGQVLLKAKVLCG